MFIQGGIGLLLRWFSAIPSGVTEEAEHWESVRADVNLVSVMSTCVAVDK